MSLSMLLVSYDDLREIGVADDKDLIASTMRKLSSGESDVLYLIPRADG
jgi:hypothetical protein